MQTYIHNIKLPDKDEFSKRFNYVSWLWQRYAETNDEKYFDEHFNAKLALEQGHPMSFLNEYTVKKKKKKKLPGKAPRATKKTIQDAWNESVNNNW